MTNKIIRKHCVYTVEVDGKDYRVAHTVWRHPQTNKLVHSWSVQGAQGMHSFARYCDPDKPTHKRVVAAVVALLEETDPLGLPLELGPAMSNDELIALVRGETA